MWTDFCQCDSITAVWEKVKRYDFLPHCCDSIASYYLRCAVEIIMKAEIEDGCHPSQDAGARELGYRKGDIRPPNFTALAPTCYKLQIGVTQSFC